MEFNNVTIRMEDGKYNRKDIGKALEYLHPNNFGLWNHWDKDYLTKAQLDAVLCRSTYPKAVEFAKYLRTPPAPAYKLAAIRNEFGHAKALAMEYGKTEAEAIEAANNCIVNVFGIDVWKELFKSQNNLTTAAISAAVKMPEAKVNKLLLVLNYQAMNDDGHFVPTTKGNATLASTGQILWHPEIVKELRELLPQ